MLSHLAQSVLLHLFWELICYSFHLYLEFSLWNMPSFFHPVPASEVMNAYLCTSIPESTQKSYRNQNCGFFFIPDRKGNYILTSGLSVPPKAILCKRYDPPIICNFGSIYGASRFFWYALAFSFFVKKIKKVFTFLRKWDNELNKLKQYWVCTEEVLYKTTTF